MRTFVEYLFEKGYYPISHNAIKTDFIRWYREAAMSDTVVEGLDVDNSDLVEMAQKAQQEAENFDQEHAVPQFVGVFEEWRNRVDTWIIYIAFASLLIGGSSYALGVLQIWETIINTLLQIVGGILLASGVTVYLLYRVLVHNIKTNTELVVKFNEELVEKPGDVRNNDQRWHMLVAQFLWNKSLLSPSTHIALVVLTVVRIVSARLYGQISVHLESEIRDAVGMSYPEFIKQELSRIKTRDFPSQPNRPRD